MKQSVLMIISMLVLLIQLGCGEKPNPNWTSIKTDNGKDLQAIFFINKSKGWIVGDAGVILHTNDGGNTFTAQQSGTDADLWSVHFQNENDGVIAGRRMGPSFKDSGVLLITHNGGKTWEKVSEGGISQLCSVRYIEKNVIIAVGLRGAAVMSFNNGETWKTGRLKNEISAYTLTKVDDETFFIGGDKEKYTFISKNGIINDQVGNIFTKIVNDNRISDAYFYDRMNGWITGIKISVSGGFIRQTQDGGKTWDEAHVSISDPMRSVWFTSMSDGWAGGGENSILKLFIGSGILLHTENGGKTWQNHNYNSDKVINDIFFVNKDTGFIAGEDGFIARYNSIYRIGEDD